MDELNSLISEYLDRAKQIKSASVSLTSMNRSFKDIFTKTKIKESQIILSEYYDWLNEMDDKYSNHLIIKRASFPPASGATETEILAVEITIVSKARDVFVQSLSSFEKEIVDIESALNFRLTTTISIVAIVISLVSVL